MKQTAALAFALAFSLLAGSSSFAAEKSLTYLKSVPPPDGSYRSSCSVQKSEPDYLRALCHNGTSKRSVTSINPQQCHGRDIRNSNGTLVC